MKLKLITTFTLTILLFSLQSCEPEGGNYGSPESQVGNNKSHNEGQDCMRCHKPGGGEAPVWKVAGTVYNEALTSTNPNATIKLYTGPDGTGVLKYTLSADAKGNFFTSTNVDFTGGLYPTVTGVTSTYSMATPITVGSCNSCHDTVTRSRIWTN